jgi:hypothetical protein
MGKSKKMTPDPNGVRCVEVGRNGWLWEAHAFVGELEFDLTFTLLDQSFIRKAKAVYEYTPEWEYLDQATGAPRVDGLSLVYGLKITTSDEDDYEPEWVEFGDMLTDGVLPNVVRDRLEQAIDDRCREIDAERRRAAFEIPRTGHGSCSVSRMLRGDCLSMRDHRNLRFKEI